MAFLSAAMTGAKALGNLASQPISNSVSNAYGVGNSSGWSNSTNGSYNSNYNATLGYEATLRAAQAAEEANRLNKYFFEEQQKFNKEEAQKNRDYQTQMANSQYQRAVQDLRKAGLNPILAAASLGSASVPTGSAASSGLQSAQMANTYVDSYGYGSGESWGQSASSNQSHEESGSRSNSESLPMYVAAIRAQAIANGETASALKTLQSDPYIQAKGNWINFKSKPYTKYKK